MTRAVHYTPCYSRSDWSEPHFGILKLSTFYSVRERYNTPCYTGSEPHFGDSSRWRGLPEIISELDLSSDPKRSGCGVRWTEASHSQAIRTVSLHSLGYADSTVWCPQSLGHLAARRCMASVYLLPLVIVQVHSAPPNASVEVYR
jgi:hypothetical protein